MIASSILILTADPAVATRLREPLAAAGHRVDVAQVAETQPADLGSHDILLIAGLPTDAAAETCRRVKGSADGGGPGICVLTASDDVDARVALLQSGADEVLVDSVDPRELEARVESLVLRFRRATRTVSGGAAAVAPPRRSIAVFSPSGGVGTTTIAVNLAVALLERHPRRVALVDLHLPFGQLATHLDLRPSLTVAQLAADEPSLHDPSQLTAYATQHPNGLSVYAAPADWAPGPEMTPAAAVTIVATATLAHDRVVVDLGSSTCERSIAVLEGADTMVLPVRPEIASLRAIRSLVDVLADRGANLDHAVFVLSHQVSSEMTLKARDIEAFLGRPADAELPHDSIVYVRAVNQGIPVLTSAPTSAPGEALARLAAIASGEQPVARADAAGQRHERRPPGLFGGIFGSRG